MLKKLWGVSALAAALTLESRCSDWCVHGTCVDERCWCSEPWSGLRCDVPLSREGVSCPGDYLCGSEGVCIQGRCFCKSPYGGVRCTILQTVSARWPALLQHRPVLKSPVPHAQGQPSTSKRKDEIRALCLFLLLLFFAWLLRAREQVISAVGFWVANRLPEKRGAALRAAIGMKTVIMRVCEVRQLEAPTITVAGRFGEQAFQTRMHRSDQQCSEEFPVMLSAAPAFLLPLLDIRIRVQSGEEVASLVVPGWKLRHYAENLTAKPVRFRAIPAGELVLAFYHPSEAAELSSELPRV